jgi:hypothetical protein
MKIILLNSLLLAFLPFFAQVNLTSGLTACYNLNGQATDAINSLNGTLSGVSPTTDRFNNPNSALTFSGTPTSMVLLPNSPLIKPSPAISISGWYKVAGFNNYTHAVFARNSLFPYITAYALSIQNTGSGYRFAAWRQDGFGDNWVEGTTVISLNTWYHVVFSIDNSFMRIYVNGQLENTLVPTITSFNYSPTKGVVLGGSDEPAANVPFLGSMDNVRFYDRMLNPAEVMALYTTDPACAASGPPPVASFTQTTKSACVGKPVVFTDLSSNAPTSWTWTSTGGTTGNAFISNPTFVFNSPSTYTVNLVASNSFGASTNTATQVITVYPNPTITASASQTIVCTGKQTTLTATGAQTYSWNTGSTNTMVVVSPNQTTTYTVTGFSANGCSAATTVALKWVSDCLTGLLDPQYTPYSITLFPIPTAARFSVRLEGSESADFMIFDIAGKKILEGTLVGSAETTIDLANYPNGIYLLKTGGSQGVKTLKILKE